MSVRKATLPAAGGVRAYGEFSLSRRPYAKCIRALARDKRPGSESVSVIVLSQFISPIGGDDQA